MSKREAPGSRPVAVVTGAGRAEGIGVEVARQLAQRDMMVVLTSRSGALARARATELAGDGLDVYGEVLDLADADSVTSFAALLTLEIGRVDVLVNNAAHGSAPGETPSTVELTDARAAMDVTLVGTWSLTQQLLPLLKRSAHGRIVMVSRGAGPGHAVSRAALRALTSTLAKEMLPEGILVNAVCPGLTATLPEAEAMGARPVAEGARGVVWAATLGDDGPTGGFFRDGTPLPW